MYIEVNFEDIIHLYNSLKHLYELQSIKKENDDFLDIYTIQSIIQSYIENENEKCLEKLDPKYEIFKEIKNEISKTTNNRFTFNPGNELNLVIKLADLDFCECSEDHTNHPDICIYCRAKHILNIISDLAKTEINNIKNEYQGSKNIKEI